MKYHIRTGLWDNGCEVICPCGWGGKQCELIPQIERGDKWIHMCPRCRQMYSFLFSLKPIFGTLLGDDEVDPKWGDN